MLSIPTNAFNPKKIPKKFSGFFAFESILLGLKAFFKDFFDGKHLKAFFWDYNIFWTKIADKNSCFVIINP